MGKSVSKFYRELTNPTGNNLECNKILNLLDSFFDDNLALFSNCDCENTKSVYCNMQNEFVALINNTELKSYEKYEKAISIYKMILVSKYILLNANETEGRGYPLFMDYSSFMTIYANRENSNNSILIYKLFAIQNLLEKSYSLFNKNSKTFSLLWFNNIVGRFSMLFNNKTLSEVQRLNKTYAIFNELESKIYSSLNDTDISFLSMAS